MRIFFEQSSLVKYCALHLWRKQTIVKCIQCYLTNSRYIYRAWVGGKVIHTRVSLGKGAALENGVEVLDWPWLHPCPFFWSRIQCVPRCHKDAGKVPPHPLHSPRLSGTKMNPAFFPLFSVFLYMFIVFFPINFCSSSFYFAFCFYLV